MQSLPLRVMASAARDLISRPWAVLVCRFSDDAHPADVLVKDLPQINDPDPNDKQTALDLFERFFTTKGNDTFNLVRYFDDMSHGFADLSDSKVFVVNLGYTKAENDAKGINPGGSGYNAWITDAAQTAALNQGIKLDGFYGIVITSHYYLAVAQGAGFIPGGAKAPSLMGWTGMDYRWVRNNGTQSWGHEIGHGFGLAHSRIDGSDEDYRDPHDIMSARAVYSAVDPQYGLRGPGLNAWNMRSRSWLDESRVWQPPSSRLFGKTLQLRPLHRRELPGFLAAELAPGYLVEYRKKEGWDAEIPRSCVQVHRFEGANSYVMKGLGGATDLGKGDVFSAGLLTGGPHVSVVDIDDDSSTATVTLSQTESLRPPQLYNPFWALETHGGLTPPSPPGPSGWRRQFAAAMALAEAAEMVAPRLRSGVLQMALKQVGVASAAIKREMKAKKK